MSPSSSVRVIAWPRDCWVTDQGNKELLPNYPLVILSQDPPLLVHKFTHNRIGLYINPPFIMSSGMTWWQDSESADQNWGDNS